MIRIQDLGSGMPTLEEVGQELFGRRLRLAVASWVLLREDPTFYQTEAARGVNYTASAVTMELELLVSLGMLKKQSMGRRLYYTRLESPLWGVIRAALDAVGEGPEDLSERRWMMAKRGSE